jgi:predicted Rossmann fold nucleotide-binding protein DprA/Smf involved in DNA uptake
MQDARDAGSHPGSDVAGETGASGQTGISPATRLALLLTLRLDESRAGSPDALQRPQPQPLDASELTRLARWIQERGRDALALPDDPERLLDGWSDRAIPVKRVAGLVARQETIDRAVARWTEQGIWVLGRKDPGYPRVRLANRLGDAIPPVFFGVGARHLLEARSTAIVGSRDAPVATLALAQELGALEARAGRTVISGGARGVDERAVQGAFLGGGTAVVILADGLARQATKVAYADHLAAGTLALISPFAPNAPFSTANAMGRNRLIYCLADESIAVASTNGKGGTFVSAREALRRGFGPIWVAPSDDPRSGNPALIQAGARLLAERPPLVPPPRRLELLPAPTEAGASQASTRLPGEALYRSFLACWRDLGAGPLTLADLEHALGLTPHQTRAWVFQAIERRDATRITSPVRYALRTPRDDTDINP